MDKAQQYFEEGLTYNKVYQQGRQDMYDELQNSEIAAHDKRLREEIIEDIKQYVRLHLKYAEHTIDDFIFAHPFYDWLDTKK